MVRKKILEQVEVLVKRCVDQLLLQPWRQILEKLIALERCLRTVQKLIFLAFSERLIIVVLDSIRMVSINLEQKVDSFVFGHLFHRFDGGHLNQCFLDLSRALLNHREQQNPNEQKHYQVKLLGP